MEKALENKELKKRSSKEIFCAICNKWLTAYYTPRHLKSESHRNNKKRYELCRTSPVKQETATSKRKAKRDLQEAPSTSTGGFTTPQKSETDYQHYQIQGSTLKKCPLHHKNMNTHECKYFEENQPPDNDIRDDHWHVKQKLFEKEQEEQRLYPDLPPPLDDDAQYQHCYTSEDTNTLDSSTFLGVIQSMHDASSDDETIILFDSENDNESDKAFCDGWHNNQIGFYACKVCNKDEKLYEEYKG